MQTSRCASSTAAHSILPQSLRPFPRYTEPFLVMRYGPASVIDARRGETRCGSTQSARARPRQRRRPVLADEQGIARNNTPACKLADLWINCQPLEAVMRSTTARERTAKDNAMLAQLCLFDVETEPETVATACSTKSPPPVALPTDATPAKASARRKRTAPQRVRVGPKACRPVSRVLTLDDMPKYPVEAIERATRALQQLPSSQLWFTYKDVRFYFGVSRATVARRLREGLVPGVTMAGASVVEDAPLRRFDREQLRWLLLAIRHHHRRQAPSASPVRT